MFTAAGEELRVPRAGAGPLLIPWASGGQGLLGVRPHRARAAALGSGARLWAEERQKPEGEPSPAGSTARLEPQQSPLSAPEPPHNPQPGKHRLPGPSSMHIKKK